VLGWTRDALTVELPGLGAVDLGLRGRHQAANAAVADALLDALAAAGIASVPAEARRRGYATATWAGRLELVEGPGGREVLLDGAHNPDGAAALATALDDLRPHLAGGRDTPAAPLTLVWAAMADKDVEGVLRAAAVSPTLAGARIVCTAPDLPRALPAAALADLWRAVLPTAQVETAPSPEAAVARALAAGGSHARGPVVVAGSLYLVGAARAVLVDDPALRDPVAG